MHRRDKIIAAGVAAVDGHPSMHERRMITIVAAMLDAGIPKREKKPTVDVSRLPYKPGEVFAEFEKHCADTIQMRPYETSSFGRLGRSMAGIQGLERADLDRVVAWVQSGGLRSWPVQVTWAHVVKHYAKWVGYARAWEDRGGGSTVGSVPGVESWR